MTAFIPDQTNEVFQVAVDLINQSNRNIFLTGKAGTGKTTFLKFIRENCPKQMAVVAPTGVAAINAGGVTIHSMFQLPLSLFIPAVSDHPGDGETINRHSLLNRLRMNTEKKKLLQELELLVIDEISMVRCDLLDAIDVVLRHIRHRPHELFGGVQMLFIGDLFQLPPVVKDEEWTILSDYYASPFFFSSQVLHEQPPVYIEFDKIYRQSDERFISLLNQVRNNQLDASGYEMLERRFNPSFSPTKDDGYITLTTHNHKADVINSNELQRLNEKAVAFSAAIEGEFPGKAYPAEEKLVLKKGCQVMFIKNDTEKIRRYYNGKIAIVTEIRDDTIIVKDERENETIEVKKDKWENIRYVVDKKTRTMEAEVIGSFTQFPLRLAWAITIHKSQGLTFEKAIIDAGDAFSPGQVYVALSRCTSLEGVVLKSRIGNSALASDKRIVEFSRQSNNRTDLTNELLIAARKYKQDLLLQLFDFSLAVTGCKEVSGYVGMHGNSFNETAISWVDELSVKVKAQHDTAVKFKAQLLRIFEDQVPLEQNSLLQQRVDAAVGHFTRELDEICRFIQQSPVTTDSRVHAKEFNDAMRELFAQLACRNYLLKGYSVNMSMVDYHQRRKKFVLPAVSVNAYAGTTTNPNDEIAHPVLFTQLRKLRDSICAQKDLPIYLVAGSSTLNEIANYLPQSLVQLRNITGFGDAKIGKYGQQFLDIVLKYCAEHNLSSQMDLKDQKRPQKREKKKEKRQDTKGESFRLYREGIQVTEIAKRRNLARTTIEGHLVYFVENGSIPIEEFVSREKLEIIGPALRDLGKEKLSLIKEKISPDISYAEIRFAIAWMEYENSRNADPN